MATGDHAWWLEKLSGRLAAVRNGTEIVHGKRPLGIDVLQGYTENDPRIPQVAGAVRPAWEAMKRRGITNLASSIVEATVDRLHVSAFYTASEADTNGDPEAWKFWTANAMDSRERTLYLLAASMRTAYAMVSDPALGAHGQPVVSIEDPRYCITAHDPLTGAVRAALKVDRDDDYERDIAYVSVAGQGAGGRCEVRRFVRPWAAGWAPDLGYGTLDGFSRPEGRVLLPFSRVNIVRYVNNPDAHLRGRAEHEAGIDVMDRIYSDTLLRLVVAVSQAFRKTAFRKTLDSAELDSGATPVYDADGEPTGDVVQTPIDKTFEMAPDAAWDLPPGWDVWESAVTDLTPLLDAEMHDLKILGAVTRTPVDLLVPDGANQSAEGASAKRETLTTKVKARQADHGRAHAELGQLAFLWLGDSERAQLTEWSTSWQPAQQYSLSERYAAAVQAKAAGVPWPTIMRDVLQFTPSDVARMEIERDADLLYAEQGAVVTGQAPAKPAAPAAAAPAQVPAAAGG